MERFVRLSTILIAVAGLGACAMGPREGPPAPIVQVTPRDSDAAQRRGQEPVEQVRETPSEVKPAPKPKPQTKVFAYKDPNAPGPEDLTPQSEQTQVAMIDPDQKAPPTPAKGDEAKAPAEPAAKPDLPSTGPVSEGAEPKQEVASVPKAPAPPVDAPKLSAAAQALASQAEKQRQSGDYTGAAASLERSLRIAPREPYLWNRLARVRMEQGQATQAGSLAARSNDLAGGSGAVKKDNWRIIAEAKRRAGDVAGAAEADKQAGGD